MARRLSDGVTDVIVLGPSLAMRQNFSPPDDQLLLDYCDAPRNWGPLLFLRPAPKQRLGLGRTLVLSALLGVLFGVIGNVLLFLFARALARPFASPYAFP